MGAQIGVCAVGCYVVNRSARYSNPLDLCLSLPITKQEELTDLCKKRQLFLHCHHLANLQQNRMGCVFMEIDHCVFSKRPAGAYNWTHTVHFVIFKNK